MGIDQHQKDTTAWRTFTSDLRLALGAWRKAPALPLISALFPLATTGVILFAAKDSVTFPAILAVMVTVMLIQVGWVGTERLWYLRIFRGDRLAGGEAAKFTMKYIPSFFILGFLMALTLWVAPLLFVAIGDSSASFIAMNVFLMIVIDVSLTFVTPSLAYSDFMVTKAFGRGFRMLRDHWHHAKYYAIVPPLAIAITSQYFAREIGVVAAVVLAVVAGLLNLWFKGATAAYYLRHNSVGRNGRFDSDVGAYIDK